MTDERGRLLASTSEPPSLAFEYVIFQEIL